MDEADYLIVGMIVGATMIVFVFVMLQPVTTMAENLCECHGLSCTSNCTIILACFSSGLLYSY